MAPRKNNAAAAGKDDGAALGKMRKINAGGPLSFTNSTTSGSSTNATTTTPTSRPANAGSGVVDMGYTAEERAFLEAQLALFTANRGAAANGGSPSTPAADFASMTKERWQAGLPVLIATTDKLLRAASEQYQVTCRNRAAAAAAAATPPTAGSGGAGGVAAGPSANAAEKDGSFSDGGRRSPSHNNMSITEAVLPAIALTAAATRPTPAAGTAAQFAEESAYILAQAQQLQWYPFTYQRWLELLLEPGKYHTAVDEGRLRGDAIQASLRRCILVTYPAVEGGDCI